MILQIVLLLVGLGLIVFGADWLVNGASAIARKSGISEFVIGLTIVGFGTSCPELVVSLTGAIQGNADVSVGNVVGSNIFNVLMILGLTALLRPICISEVNKKIDIPMTLGVTVLLVVCGMSKTLFGIGQSDSISRVEGIVFLLIFAAYLYYCFKSNSGAEEASEDTKEYKTIVAVGLVAAGMAGLIFGGRLFVDSACNIARAAGVSDKFIAVTLLAGGTSLPELATCIVAAAKGKDQLSLGNILGSCVFNILLILGVSATITPLSFAGMNYVDVAALTLSMLFLLMVSYTGTKNVLDRWEGVVLLLMEAGYLVYLVSAI